MNDRKRPQVEAFIDGLRTYKIEKRAKRFVVVVCWKENPFDPDLLRRKSVTVKEDASKPFATQDEAYAFIARRKAR